jgi:L-alanine-DL-glutamate epimerase-like enolase superfamily enzyme
MKIDAIDAFYLSMPKVTEEADGSQDALVMRVRAGRHTGWGECEASPLASIAALVAPMSHGACRSVAQVVLGERLEDPADIARIGGRVRYECMDLLQAPHTFSGVEAALWDVLGKARSEPAWRLLGYRQSFGKSPYASQLFGDEPQETLERGRTAAAAGYRAMKFGWGPFGRGELADDVDQLTAAREGIGPDATLLVDAGQIFGEDVAAAARRLPALEEARALWLEEPFAGHALAAHASLAAASPKVGLAGGEAAHNELMARNLIDFGHVRFIQIDCGRIGGIGPAHAVAAHAVKKGLTYVNHTYTSHLALSQSLQPYAGLADHRLAEYPVTLKPLAHELTVQHLDRDGHGEIRAPDAVGLGIDVDAAALARYLVETEIRVGGRVIYRTPALD